MKHSLIWLLRLLKFMLTAPAKTAGRLARKFSRQKARHCATWTNQARTVMAKRQEAGARLTMHLNIPIGLMFILAAVFTITSSIYWAQLMAGMPRKHLMLWFMPIAITGLLTLRSMKVLAV